MSTQNYQDRFLPVLSGTSAITGLSDPWNFDSTLDTVFRDDKIKPGNYLLSVDENKPSAADLEADSVVSGGDLTETGSLAQSVRDTAQAVTGRAPERSTRPGRCRNGSPTRPTASSTRWT